MRFRLGFWFAMLTSLASGLAQSPSEESKFEVVEIKRNNSERPATGSGDLWRGGQTRFNGISLRLLIAAAWQVKDYAIVGGPGWLSTDRFDLVAKAAPKTSATDFHRMLQALLIERFHLQVHTRDKIMPVFALVVDQAAANLEATKAGDSDPMGCSGQREHGLAYRTCQNTSMALFAEQLPKMSPHYIERPVLDLTGLTGRFDFKLFWEPQQVRSSDKLDTGPTIFEALKSQLGLKLESRKLPVPIIVIDRCERLQGDNWWSVKNVLFFQPRAGFRMGKRRYRKSRPTGPIINFANGG